MSKVDSFFILILVLLSGLTVTYKVSQYGLGDAQLQISENRALKKRIQQLELKQKDIELNLAAKTRQGREQRSVASLAPTVVHAKIDSPVELNPARLAQGLYKGAFEQCVTLKKEIPCLDKIDAMVTQFPESSWAGRSLVLLTGLYVKQRKYEQAAELVKIVRHEFQNDAEVLRQLNEIEENAL